MTSDMGRLVHADLASIRTDAQNLPASGQVLSQVQDGPDVSAGFSFAESMKSAVQGVDAKERVAADKMAAVDSGSSDDLVGAMLASQDASLSFSMLMQVRNKVMGAVEDLVKLPL
ncbi:flagellar hook-basal body complex protein FliE [soil metagenome]